MTEDVHETPSNTPNFKTKLAKQLEELVPEAIADGKVDVAKLKELLDGDAADESERFGLFWPGKKRAIRAAQAPTTATLKPAPELSKDWDSTQNVFIEGDNLETLKILQKHYHGKIKMIYIDPPYNTGKDFVYPDNYKEGLQTYLEWTKQVNEEGKKLGSNSETDGRYHSHWLNMMYPRLKLARSLLSDDGVIVISIDDVEQENLKKICNEIFGERNFIATLPRQTAAFGKNDEPFIASAHDYLYLYQRGGLSKLARNPESGKDLFNLKDAIGLYRLGAVLDASSLPYSSNLDFPIELDGVTYQPAVFEGKNTCWRWSQRKVEFGIRHGLIVAKNGRLYTKTYRDYSIAPVGEDYSIVAKEAGGPFRSNIFMNNEFGNRRATRTIADFGIPFDSPKPVSLIVKLIQFIPSGTSDGIILDFFSGSATTAQAVMELNAQDGGNRRHIQVQLPEPVDLDSVAGKTGFKTIADIARKRIDLAGEKIKQDYAEQIAKRDTPLDLGYRTYKLTDTNFSKWREPSDTDATTLEQHLLDLRENADDDADQLALLTEILLKQGYSLAEKVEPVQVDGLDVLSVANGLALAYVNEHVKPSLEQLRALVDREPERLIVLEDAFQGDDQLKTNLVQLAKTKHVNLWTA